MYLICAKCGGSIDRQTGPGGRRKFCAACSPQRVRKDRPRKRDTVTPLPPRPASDQDTGGVYGATSREVEALGMTEHYLGVLSLLLAWHMDHADDLSGSALASLAKCFRETHAEMQAAAPKFEDSPLDRLRRRRIDQNFET